jgi:hypothetical protein
MQLCDLTNRSFVRSSDVTCGLTKGCFQITRKLLLPLIDSVRKNEILNSRLLIKKIIKGEVKAD